MLVLLTRVLLWASVGVLIWYILARVIPKKFLTWFGGVILILLLVLSFADPDDSTVSVIWQILSFPLTPLGAAIVFLGTALMEGPKKARGTPAAIALSILIFSSIPIFAQWLVSDAEQSVRTAYTERVELCEGVCRDGEIPTAGNLAEAGAIVVLGDSNDIDRAINVSDTPADVSINTVLAPRLIYAGNLYRRARDRGASPVVIVTAGTRDNSSEQREIISTILAQNGVPAGAVEIENTGLDIYRTARDVEEQLESRRIISPRTVRRAQGTTDDPRVVLVAPALVMSRAALTFERINLEVIAKPTDFYTAQFDTSGDVLTLLPEILPNVEALQLTTRYWNEVLNSLYYFLRGWLPNFNFGWDRSIEV